MPLTAAATPSTGEQFLSAAPCTRFTVQDAIYCPDNMYVVAFSHTNGNMLANAPIPSGYSVGYDRSYVQGVRSPFLRIEPGRMVLAIGADAGRHSGIGLWDRAANTMTPLACADDTSIVYAVADDRQVVWVEEHAGQRDVRTVAY
jgi:hypothetical protein